MLLALLLVTAPSPRADTHERALAAFKHSSFARAAELFREELRLLSPSDKGSAVERNARELLVYSLYDLRKDEAVHEYQELVDRFPDFHLSEDQVLPETVRYLESRVTRHEALPPQQIKVVTLVTEPRANAPWHWYYLAPLGVGQFLAHSPVRGSIFAVTQGGFLALNLAAYAAFAGQTYSDHTAVNVGNARAAQILADVGFIGVIAAVITGVIDGAFFERDPL